MRKTHRGKVFPCYKDAKVTQRYHGRMGSNLVSGGRAMWRGAAELCAPHPLTDHRPCPPTLNSYVHSRVSDSLRNQVGTQNPEAVMVMNGIPGPVRAPLSHHFPDEETEAQSSAQGHSSSELSQHLPAQDERLVQPPRAEPSLGGGRNVRVGRRWGAERN